MAASESSLSKPYVFRGAAHVVTVGLSSSQLVVSVEDRVTGNQWKGAFSATDVEELTEKTGHYENFADFVLLLKSAVTQSSEAVTLDLLTLADLKLLHSSRAGSQATSSSATMATDASNKKRFLLLIRSIGPNSTIKYPLRLRYTDPLNLHDTIRLLQEENTKLKQQRQKDYILKELETLKRDYDRLLKEKEEVENEFLEYRREMETSSMKRSSSSQEIQILKDFIKALEKDLADDQRIITKRKDQYRKVLVELDDVKARERNLQVRVKSLTNELAQYKRRGSRAYPGSLNNSRPVNSNSRNSSQTSARNLSTGLRYHTSRDSSGLSSDRSQNRSQNRSSRPRFPNHSLSTRDRSSSRESCLSARNRVDSRERSLSKDRFRSPNTSGGSYRMKSPSPSGNRTPRFNPTAFQADKLRRQRESELKKKRQINTKLAGVDVGKSTRTTFSGRSDFSANSREFRRSRTPSFESIHSMRSSIESLSDIPFPSDASQGQNRFLRETGRARDVREQNGHTLPPPKTGKVRITGKVLSSTPDDSQRTRSRLRPSNKENHIADASNHSATKSREISELDERLSRIQQFLHENDIK